jgi:tight adherence protein C
MTRILIYQIILIAPLVIFSVRIILIELIKTVSISDYSTFRFRVHKIISFITGSQIDQNKVNEELVSILQMVSIMISSGESPVSSLKYIADRSEGILPDLIRKQLNKLENEGSLLNTLEFLAVTSNSKQVKRLGNSIQVAVDRGSPLLQVIHNQISAINKEIHLNLLKKSGKSEIALLIPVVFLILPISILFAIWPSLYSLNFGGI